MPVTIGAKPSPDFSNPIELLTDCHRRIERFLGVLMKVAAQAEGGPMTKEQSREWEQALDYFRNAAPRHTADEEESLFPRLRGLDHPEVERALSEMQELEADHQQAAQWHETVDQLGRKWLSETVLVSHDAGRLSQALASLSELYSRHIALEDDSLFPIATAVLGGSDKANIGTEMAQRRGLDPQRLAERLVELSNPAT
ncbi:MAG: hemerythrin domain-containing protein [Bryobacteraceae bacterium]